MNKIGKRIEFLAEKFKVFTIDETSELISKFTDDVDVELTIISLNKEASDVFGLKEVRTVHKGDKVRYKQSIMVSEIVFSKIINSDPSKNKMYSQWMLNIFVNLIKDGRLNGAIRFVTEDLTQANEYLKLFDANKRKQLFYDLCSSNLLLSKIKDPSNINQYGSLSTLFDAVDPFVERDLSNLAKNMGRFVDSGQALMPVRDRNYTVFVPLTRDANVLFDSVSSWCTAKPNNGMFKSYTNNNTPLGTSSKIYIIINNRVLDSNFSGKISNNMLYQIHFESNQIRDRSNGPNVNIYEDIILKSPIIGEYFYNELMPLAKAHIGNVGSNKYVRYLIDFGFTDVLFDMLDTDKPTIKFKDINIPKLPSLSRFKNLNMIFLANVNLVSLDCDLFTLPNLEVISIPNNKITTIPDEICNCNNLVFMNLVGNPIRSVPDEIYKLDKANGGKLDTIAISVVDTGNNVYDKLKELLPNVNLCNNKL